jgi:hypothetical protein
MGTEEMKVVFSDAKILKDAIRLEELRQIPVASRSKTESAEFSRLYQRERRRQEKTGLAKGMLDKIATRGEFHALNRKNVDGKLLHRWAELHERVLDQLRFMEHGNKINGVELPETDPDFIHPDEAEDDLDDFVREHGVARLGYIYRDEKLKGSDWSTEYWKDAEVLLSMKMENEPTKIFALFGYLVAIPDWKYEEWKRAHGKKPLVDVGKWVDRNRVRYR